jgi:hypothetical protein
MSFQEGRWGEEGGFILEVYARREEKNMVTLDDYITRLRPKDQDPASLEWFARFKHAETKVGGLRAFESYTSNLQGRMNHHWSIELDPQRQLWVSLLGDCKVSAKNLDAFPGLVAHLEATVKSMRFILAAAPPLVVSRTDAPLPRAFIDEAITENEIAHRPPPPPADAGGGRRTRAVVASAPPPGAPPSKSNLPPPSAPPPSRGNPPGARTAFVSTPAPAPPARQLPPPPPGRSAAPAPPARQMPPPPSSMAGAASVRAGVAVTVVNSSRTPWTRCTVMIPGRRSTPLPSLAAGARVDLPLSGFVADRYAASLTNEVLVRCAEGSVKFPARF